MSFVAVLCLVSTLSGVEPTPPPLTSGEEVHAGGSARLLEVQPERENEAKHFLFEAIGGELGYLGAYVVLSQTVSQSSPWLGSALMVVGAPLAGALMIWLTHSLFHPGHEVRWQGLAGAAVVGVAGAAALTLWAQRMPDPESGDPTLGFQSVALMVGAFLLPVVEAVLFNTLGGTFEPTAGPGLVRVGARGVSAGLPLPQVLLPARRGDGFGVALPLVSAAF